MNDKWYQISGMAGFVIAGLFFISSGIIHGDMLTVAGSVIWTIACFIMMVPLFQR